MWQLFYSFSLYIVQPLLKSTHYDLVNSLDLFIPLGISWGSISIRNSQVTTVSYKRFAVKLKAIVRDGDTRDPEPCDNVFPNEFLSIHVPDIFQGLNFNPFSEVICANQQISFIPHCLRERANNVQAPLSKWPRAGQGVKDPSRLVDVWCISLALITLFYIFFFFFLYVCPPVALSDGLVR